MILLLLAMSMNIVLVFILMVVAGIGLHAAAEVDYSGWEKVEINDSLMNSSSTTLYTIMVTPGTTHFSNDTSSGPTTVFKNDGENKSAYGVYIFDNPSGKNLTADVATSFLNDFMAGAGITPVEGSKPAEISDGIFEYGFQGEKVAVVYVLSTNEKVSIVSGFFSTMDDASAGIEKLAMTAASIRFSPVN